MVKTRDGIASSRPHDPQLFINMHPVRDLGPTVDDSDASLLPLIKYTEGNSFDLRGISNFLSSDPELDPKLQCAALQLLEHAAEWQNPNFTDNVPVTFGPVAKLLLDSQDNLVHLAALDTLKIFLASPRATDIVKSMITRRIVDVVSNDFNSSDPLVQLASVELLDAAARSEEILVEFSAAVSRIPSLLPSMPPTTQLTALRVLEISACSRTHELVKAVADNFRFLIQPLSSPETTVQIAVVEVLEAAARTKDSELAHAVKAFRRAARKVLEAATHNDELTDAVETTSLKRIPVVHGKSQVLRPVSQGSDKSVDPIDVGAGFASITNHDRLVLPGDQ